jgi:hypothetical protein
MPDIAMCDYKDCPKAKECYRFMAEPSQWKSYMEFKNICGEWNKYKWFWKMDK